MESSPCPVSLSINPSDGRDPREWILKLKEQKPIYPPGMASILALCLPQRKVKSDSDYPLVTLPAGGPVCQPGCEAGTLSSSGCSLLAHAWPSLLLHLSSSLWNLPDCFSYLGSQGVHQQNEKQPVNWVRRIGLLNSHFHIHLIGFTRSGEGLYYRIFLPPWSASATEEEEPAERGEQGGFWGRGEVSLILKNKLIFQFSQINLCLALVRVHFLSRNLRPGSSTSEG